MSDLSVVAAGAEAPGFYGKWPGQGDFVSRRLPGEFVEPWDSWLQAGLRGSQTQLGPAWLDIYLTSPIWNFVLCGGICGLHPWCGVLMPSVDRVGRYFPLTVASRLPLDANPLQLLGSDRWFAGAHALLLRALGDSPYPLTTFDRDVAQLGPPFAGAPQPHAPNGSGFGDAWQIPLAGPVSSGLPAVFHQLLSQRCGQYSLWWGEGSQRVVPSLLVARALPSTLQFTALFDGQWDAANWSSWPAADAL